MENDLKETVERYKDIYKELTGQTCILKSCGTPFIPEDTQEAPSRAPGDHCPWCQRLFDPQGTPMDNPQSACPAEAGYKTKQTEGSMDTSTNGNNSHNRSRATERTPLLNRKTKKRSSSTPPTPVNPIQAENRGRLEPKASSILMQIMYAARLARHDLLRPVSR